jgi:NADPH-dependent glutamate synthase beta subunit-like oxidoreductase
MGFVNPVATILEGFGVEKDGRGNAKASTDFTGGYATNVSKVFAAGDIRRGPVAGGLGDPRRTPGRARRGRVPDGFQRPAALNPSNRGYSGFT